MSEEIKRLAGLLEDEMLGWPNVTSRPMFGLNGIYRGPNIFAVLPRTRAMEVPVKAPAKYYRSTRQRQADRELNSGREMDLVRD